MASVDTRDASRERLLAVNAGSSSLKVALFTGAGEGLTRVVAVEVSRIGDGAAELRVRRSTPSAARGPHDETKREVAAPDHAAALAVALDAIADDASPEQLFAVGHRIVHGGARFDAPTRIDDGVLDALRGLASLDPDHLPAAIAVVEALSARAPRALHVASFDTAFHRDLPRVARLLPLPSVYETRGVRRYGFHGLSCDYVVGELARIAGDAAAKGRVVIAHLGSGASLTAVHDGRSIDTTMAYTPCSGVPMRSRAGDLDPGVVLALLREDGASVDSVDRLLNRHAGLAGLSESSGDMRDLLAREATDARAADAVGVFCHAVKKAIGALAAVLGGLDTLVFTGGIGEHAAPVRARACAGLEHLGVRLDDAKNAAGAEVVSAAGTSCVVRVMTTDEERVLARDAWRLAQRPDGRADGG